MILKRYFKAIILALVCSKAFAIQQTVTVCLNPSRASLEFKSTDLFDAGEHLIGGGCVSHTYEHGPKNLLFKLHLFAWGGNTPKVHLDESCQGFNYKGTLNNGAIYERHLRLDSSNILLSVQTSQYAPRSEVEVFCTLSH